MMVKEAPTLELLVAWAVVGVIRELACDPKFASVTVPNLDEVDLSELVRKRFNELIEWDGLTSDD